MIAQLSMSETRQIAMDMQEQYQLAKEARGNTTIHQLIHPEEQKGK
jgi:hypothetical protein